MNNASAPALRTAVDFQLGGLLRTVAASLRQLHEHPALAWITPELPVRLIDAGGGESLWLAGRRVESTPANIRTTRFTAVEVPSDLALSRSLLLPRLRAADLRNAVALDIRHSSPFDPADLVWGFRASDTADGQLNVISVLASRRQVLERLQQVTPAGQQQPEAWVLVDEEAPVLLGGFGEAARSRRAARRRMLAYPLLVTALMLATAMAVTPTVQLHLRTLQAVAAYQALQQRAAPAMAQREALLRGREDLVNLQEVMSEHIDPLVAIETLTRLIPDDTWLQRVQAQGPRFSVSGQTPNAAALMNTLSSNPGLRDVRAPLAATRTSGTSREVFVLEFTMAPELLRGASPSSVQGPPAAATPAIGTTALTATTTAATAPATAPTTAATTATTTATAAPGAALAAPVRSFSVGADAPVAASASSPSRLLAATPASGSGRR